MKLNVYFLVMSAIIDLLLKKLAKTTLFISHITNHP